MLTPFLDTTRPPSARKAQLSRSGQVQKPTLSALVFTSGAIARLYGMSITTVNRWIDQGYLRGFLIPGSRHRRVTGAELLRCAREQGLPLPLDLDPDRPRRALAVGFGSDRELALKGHLLDRAGSTFEAGILSAEIRFHRIILDTSLLGQVAAKGVAREIRNRDPACQVVLVESWDSARAS